MSFVCFNPKDGSLLAVTNIDPTENFESELAWEFIEVELTDVINILEGKTTPQDYKVEWSKVHEKYLLHDRGVVDIAELDVTEIVYQIPEESDYTYKTDDSGNELLPDITVVRDVKNTCWKFLIGTQFAQKIKLNFEIGRLNVHFSITEYNNPNILYRTMLINLEDLARNHYTIIDFKDEYETSTLPLSVFTVKRYDDYVYKENR